MRKIGPELPEFMNLIRQAGNPNLILEGDGP